MIVSKIMATNSVTGVAILSLGLINPAPLLVGLQKAKIEYTFVDPLEGGNIYA